jgi:transcriptional regulator with XRE-family HTH domain
MPKSIYREDYALFLRHLRQARERAGLTQEQVAERLELTQTFVSKCERGERRLDIIELRDLCRAIEIPLAKFVAEFETALKQRKE